jgi:hypothetical protein
MEVGKTRLDSGALEMTRLNRYTAAKEYVDKQLATMKKYGSEPRLTKKRYLELVQEIVKVVERATAS